MDWNGFCIGLFIILFKYGVVFFFISENNGNGIVFLNN